MATLDAHLRGAASVVTLTEGDGTAVRVPDDTLVTLERKGLRITGGQHQGRLLLHLVGKLDAATAPLLRQTLEASSQGMHLDLDLTGCARADGVGLAMLVRLATMLADRQGSLRLLSPSAALRQTMTRVNLHHLVEIIDAPHTK